MKIVGAISLVMVTVMASGCAARREVDRNLAEAARRNDIAGVKTALEQGANPDTSVDSLSTTSHALNHKNQEMMALLIDAGLSSTAIEGSLATAAFQGDAAMVRWLMQKRPMSAAVYSAALINAAASPSPATAKALLEAGADPNAVRRPDGATPLIVAAREGYTATAAALLAAGAEVDRREVSSRSALDWAVARKQDDLIALLSPDHAPPAGGPTLAELKQEQREARSCPLSLMIPDIATDGRHVKIRGTVANRCGEPVEGIRYLVRILDAANTRELDRFRRETDDSLDPGESTALRIDYATMYASGHFRLDVQALPIKLGAKMMDEPPGW
ncbi:MAG TPA: ankyrin repeat domain-containing protein [Terriglobales bacterium]|nr:ankyrin repeat domain-containing protein [Terriglobales bacterium]